MPARIAGNATTRYAWVVLFRPTPENVGLRYLATLNKLTRDGCPYAVGAMPTSRFEAVVNRDVGVAPTLTVAL